MTRPHSHSLPDGLTGAPGSALDGTPALITPGYDGQPCNAIIRTVRIVYITSPDRWGLQAVPKPQRDCCYCGVNKAEYVNTVAGRMSAMCMPCLARREGRDVFDTIR